jgi:hypothetical protein
MKLPNGERAIIEDSKVRDYCLNALHWQGRHKARVFASIGIGQNDSAILMDALRLAAREEEARLGSATPYGQRDIVDFDLFRHGRAVRIRSTWMVRTGENVPRLTTCYVL